MTLALTDIWTLAGRYVPLAAADRRLHEDDARSWWPAHEIGHFLVATPAECRERKFGIDMYEATGSYATDLARAEAQYRYVIAKEMAAISISQRLLRRSGHAALADDEIECTDETTLDCSFERWCKHAVQKLLRANRAVRLPTTAARLEKLLVWKTAEVIRANLSTPVL